MSKLRMYGTQQDILDSLRSLQHPFWSRHSEPWEWEDFIQSDGRIIKIELWRKKVWAWWTLHHAIDHILQGWIDERT